MKLYMIPIIITIYNSDCKLTLLKVVLLFLNFMRCTANCRENCRYCYSYCYSYCLLLPHVMWPQQQVLMLFRRCAPKGRKCMTRGARSSREAHARRADHVIYHPSKFWNRLPLIELQCSATTHFKGFVEPSSLLLYLGIFGGGKVV